MTIITLEVNMQVVFIDEEHKSFYNEKIMQYANSGRIPNCYIKSLFYLLASNADTRRNFNNLYDIENGEINPSKMKGGWLTSTTKKICQLAFNLYNGYTQDGRKKCSEEYAPYNLFSCEMAPYFVQAIQLRYPEHFRTCL